MLCKWERIKNIKNTVRTWLIVILQSKIFLRCTYPGFYFFYLLFRILTGEEGSNLLDGRNIFEIHIEFKNLKELFCNMMWEWKGEESKNNEI